VTDTTGVASASLTTAGDPTNRDITVTATAGTLAGAVSVAVAGSQLSISGPDSLVQGDTATYTIVLVDGAGSGIPGETISISSSNGNTLAATTLTTDVSGQAQVDVTASNGGQDTLTATGLGLSASRVLTVSDDSFAFSTPANNAEIVLNSIRVVTVIWLKNGVPQAGESVSFATTRGIFVDAGGVPLAGPPIITTLADGSATIRVLANNAGPAVITADADGGPTTQLPIEFIATTPATIEVQADPFTIAPNNQATVTATVRDVDNNRVKNATVAFTLLDITGGELSVGSADTDSQGRAQTFYTASDVLSGAQGVTVSAFIESDPSISDAINITVARRELFVAIGTGNELAESTDTTAYEVPYLVIVTDSEGNGVPDANVQLDIRSVRYSKGIWVQPAPAEPWAPLVRATCDDEDLNGNGLLDPDEIDENNNETIEAGNVVEVVGGDQVTDAEGKFLATLRYAKIYGAWTEVQLRAQVSVGGSENAEDLTFVLDVTADDVQPDVAPPGLLKPPDPILPSPFDTSIFRASPWGYADNCAQDF
ncbi:MAG: Ig-like domain-containing protein, partial [Gammaproteobacteria bacterium]|nr:Ig-like domain-containing protein [Gammaproteobacteria bacterium]